MVKKVNKVKRKKNENETNAGTRKKRGVEAEKDKKRDVEAWTDKSRERKREKTKGYKKVFQKVDMITKQSRSHVQLALLL